MGTDGMKTIKGPGVFLAQFAADQAPYDSLPSLAKWAGFGRVGAAVGGVVALVVARVAMIGVLVRPHAAMGVVVSVRVVATLVVGVLVV